MLIRSTYALFISLISSLFFMAGCGVAKASSACVPLECENNQGQLLLIAEDADHCEVKCCTDDRECVNHFMPWINKQTKKADAWYDIGNKKMVKAIGEGAKEK